MLIESARHTTADIDIWQGLESCDELNSERPRLSRIVDDSLDALTEFVAQGACYCGVSWGKDSVVVAHLLGRVAPEVPLVHLRPTNHNPDCDSVRNVYFRRYKQLYYEIAVDYADLHNRDLPQHELDAETDRRWNAAWGEARRRFGPRHISGIRAGESTGRALRCYTHGINSPNTCAPLSWWRTEDVFAYLWLRSLPVHPAYACLGGGRWSRERIRVAEIGDTHGAGGGRAEWEREYYGDALRRLEANG